MVRLVPVCPLPEDSDHDYSTPKYPSIVRYLLHLRQALATAEFVSTP